MSKNRQRTRRVFTGEFKQDAVNRVANEGCSFKSVAAVVKISENSLRIWYRKLVPPPEPCGCDATVKQLRTENKQLRKQLGNAKRESEILKKSSGVFHERVAVKYAWIKQYRDSYSIAIMCHVLEVSKSGFYQWLAAKPCMRAQRTASIQASVKDAYDQSNGIYGSQKITRKLQEEAHLETACRNTVAKAMKKMGLASRVSRKFKPLTTVCDPNKKPAPNILDQDFKASSPNKKWVSDITYLPTSTGWAYLAVVIDLFSRKVVGWSMSDRLEASLVIDAIWAAIDSRQPDTKELIHHSDRGSQYTSDAFQQILQLTDITCSMSRTGCCYDNAVAERFFWSLKHEWTKFELFENLDQARLSVCKYIETFYNSERIHQTLNYKTPDQFESEYH